MSHFIFVSRHAVKLVIPSADSAHRIARRSLLKFTFQLPQRPIHHGFTDDGIDERPERERYPWRHNDRDHSLHQSPTGLWREGEYVGDLSEIRIFGDEGKARRRLIPGHTQLVEPVLFRRHFAVRTILVADGNRPGRESLDLQMSAAPFGMLRQIGHVCKYDFRLGIDHYTVYARYSGYG
jgi:hypothetical protein